MSEWRNNNNPTFASDQLEALGLGAAPDTLPGEEAQPSFEKFAPLESEVVKAKEYEGLGARFHRSQTMGLNPDASFFDKFMSSKGVDINLFNGKPTIQQEPVDLMSAADANEKYAPKGVEDWFDSPISDELAKQTAHDKRDQAAANLVLERYNNTTSWLSPRDVGYGVWTSSIATIHDPLSLATFFIPGPGEAAVAARLGGGALAHIAGHGVAGAIGTDIATLPELAFQAHQDPDFTLGQAATELATNAIFGAVLQGGVVQGTREFFKWKMSPSVAHSAISNGVAQMLEEHPVDITANVYQPASDLDIRNTQMAAAAKGIDIPPGELENVASIFRTSNDIEFAMVEAKKVRVPVTLKDVVNKESALAENGSVPGLTPDEFAQLKKTAAEAAAAPEPKPTPLEEPPPEPVVHETMLQEILDSPEVKASIENPQFNRANDVPYIAGASKGESRVTNIDNSIPESLTLDGVTFDPAIPLNIHEQVEKKGMELLIAQGMSEQQAYKAAHHLLAEKAEEQWIKSKGISWEKWQTWIDERLPGIQDKKEIHPPKDLYEKVYPHDRPSMAKYEPTGPVPAATPKEKAAVATPETKALAGVHDPEALAEIRAFLNSPEALRVEAYDQAAQCLIEAGI